MSTHQTSTVRSQAAGERGADWRRDAYCAKHDPELWFGTDDSRKGQPLHSWELAAKRLCTHHCPALAECRAWTLGSSQQFGVSGGMAAQERAETRSVAEPDVEDERTRTIRQLAATGMSDPEIAVVVGRNPKTVCDIRRRAGIPPGLPQGRNRRAS